MRLEFFLTFVLAFLFAIYGTPVAIAAARKFGVVDKPDGNLKTHKEPVPYLGGLAVYLSFLLALGMVYDFSREVLGIILSGTIVVLLGLIDDFGVLSPGMKFLGQLVAVFILLKSGVMITVIALPPWLAILLTIFWMIGIINGFNIIDVMDGLSSGIAFFASLAFFVVAVINSEPMIAIISIALAGSLLGFLYYNFEPAKIYLGDTGSMFIGLILGALAMTGKYSFNNNVGFLAPLVILAVPIFDTILVMYLRALRRKSIFLGSKDHFALRLRKWTLSVRRTVLLSYGASLCLSILGIAVIFTDNTTALSLVAVILLFFLLIARWLKRIDVGF